MEVLRSFIRILIIQQNRKMSITNIRKIEVEQEDSTDTQAMRCCAVWTVNLVLSFLETKTKNGHLVIVHGKKILVFL